MSWVRPILMCLAATIAVPSAAFAQQLVYIVRHAERADGGAGTGQMQAQNDPMLSEAGHARAAKLVTILGDAGVKAIYVTEFRRTQDTGKPLASKLGLAVQSYASRDADALAARLKKEHARDVVLVIGHSNTIPAIVKALGAGEIAIRDDEYDALLVVVPGSGVVSRIRF